MKKIIFYILVSIWIVGIVSMGTVYAEKPTIDELLPTVPKEFIQETRKDVSSNTTVNEQEKAVLLNWIDRIADVNNLPQGSVESIIAGVITLILGLGGTLAMLSLVVAGVFYIIAQDDEEMVNKAKKIITYSLVGLIVISVSFAIFTGLSRLFL